MSELSGYVYRCSAGETFDSIALAIYDDEKYAADLMNANPGYVHKIVFSGDEVLSLPVVEKQDGEESGNVASVAPWKE